MPNNNLICIGVRTIQELGRIAIGKNELKAHNLEPKDKIIVYLEKVI